MDIFKRIAAQQKGNETSPIWTVGEQLKEICRRDPHCEELVGKDLDDEKMSLAAVEKKIRAWANGQKRTGNCVCVPPHVADRIIREFFGLPDAATVPSAAEQQTTQPATKSEPVADFLDLDDFL